LSQHAATLQTARYSLGSSAKGFLYSSIFWLIIAMLFGMIVALKSIDPNFLTGNAVLQKYLSYGRIRPVHTNTAFFGWLSAANFGLAYYIIPQLCRVPLWSERLGRITVIGWNIMYVIGLSSILLGYQDAIEYGEMPIIPDILLILVGTGVAYNILRTVLARKERQMYVSIWYMTASVVWLALAYFMGNIPTRFVAGIEQAGFEYFFVHNVIGLWFTPFGIGVFYYLLPKLVNRPIYSHRLSLIGFWTIAATYSWNGPHHLINGPIPVWLMKAGIIPSLLLIIPVWSVLANFIGTMKGQWHQVAHKPILKFLLTGGLFYLLACIQGPFQALMGPNAVLHFTYWVVGHSHMAVFGAFSLVAFAGIYYVIPRIVHKRVWSMQLMEWHFWFSTIGLLIFGFAMWTAGVIQGFAWMDGAQFGTAWVQVLLRLHPYLIARAVGGSFMLMGQLSFVVNIIMTVRRGEEVDERDLNPPLTLVGSH